MVLGVDEGSQSRPLCPVCVVPRACSGIVVCIPVQAVTLIVIIWRLRIAIGQWGCWARALVVCHARLAEPVGAVFTLSTAHGIHARTLRRCVNHAVVVRAAYVRCYCTCGGQGS